MTTQQPDIITYQYKKYLLASEPLFSFFMMPGNKPIFIQISTDYLRGYQAEWQIIDDSLYLMDVKCYSATSNTQGIKLIFPDQLSPIHANWYSGELRLQTGRYIERKESGCGYDALYENELSIKVEAGHCVHTRIVRHSTNLI